MEGTRLLLADALPRSDGSGSTSKSFRLCTGLMKTTMDLNDSLLKDQNMFVALVPIDLHMQNPNSLTSGI